MQIIPEGQETIPYIVNIIQIIYPAFIRKWQDTILSTPLVQYADGKSKHTALVFNTKYFALLN
jgi:hypothetical protein